MAKINRSRSGSKKDEPALKQQYSRTRFLNKLASEINSIITSCTNYGGKSRDFDFRVQSCFRNEPLNNRYLLLRQLKDIEINQKHPSGNQEITVNVSKNNLIVELFARSHPDHMKPVQTILGTNVYDSYSFEVILLTWDKTEKRATHSGQLSDWICYEDKDAVFEFRFPIPKGTVNWMICVRRQLGFNEEPKTFYGSECMYVAEAGTFDKKEEEIVAERFKEDNKTLAAALVKKKKVDTRERVKKIKK